MTREQALLQFCIRMGDNYLILGQRLSELCGFGPILEQDIALTNIALDELGQARFYLEYAAKLEGRGRTEDELAFSRDVFDYRNALLLEQPNGDFAQTLTRQFFFDMYNHLLVTGLLKSTDETIRGIAGKAIKEITYHLRFSTDWMLRLGDGTEESHRRAQSAIDNLWKYTGDLFTPTPGTELLVKENIIPDPASLWNPWLVGVREVLAEATLSLPEETYMIQGSMDGNHTEHLGYILAELQYLPRAYPGVTW